MALGDRKASLPPFSFSKNLIFLAMFLHIIPTTQSSASLSPSPPEAPRSYFLTPQSPPTTQGYAKLQAHSVVGYPSIRKDDYCISE